MFILLTLTTDEIADKNTRIESLLMEMANGEKSAVGALYDLIRTDVFAFALSKTRNKFDAEDITQDTFVQIYKKAKLYTPKGKPMAWIITMELNIIRRQFQLKSRYSSFEEDIERETACASFENGVINNEFLRELMKTLTEEEREIVVLHVVSGFKHREIAKLLNKPLSTVLSKYNRAIKKLQAVVVEGE